MADFSPGFCFHRCAGGADLVAAAFGGEGRRGQIQAVSAPEGRIATEPLPEVHTEHRNYFENYVKAYHGEEEFLVQIPEVRRILKLMDAIRESGRTGKSIDFE